VTTAPLSRAGTLRAVFEPLVYSSDAQEAPHSAAKVLDHHDHVRGQKARKAAEAVAVPEDPAA
jgi:hypothetical protein